MHPIQRLVERDHQSPQRLIRLLRRRGFRRLGGGASTVTYGNDEVPYVVKVNEHHDPAAYKFYSMVAHKQSPYFPKVHLLKTYVTFDGEFLFIAVMEKLHELDGATWRSVNKRGRGFTSWLATMPGANIEVLDLEQDRETMADDWAAKNGSLIRQINTILGNTVYFAETDLFDANLMVRLPDGDVVLNDPLCTIM